MPEGKKSAARRLQYEGGIDGKEVQRRKTMKRTNLMCLAVAVLSSAVSVFLAQRHCTDLEITMFDYQMSEWKKRVRDPERK